MANIFQLYGSIFIDNEKANASIDETTKKGQDASEKLGVSFSDIAAGAAAVGTAVVTAAVSIGKGAYEVAMSTATAADTVDKLSERTGINREELQRWMHACDQSGVSSDSLSTAVKKASKAIEEAGAGSKNYVEALDAIGLSYDDLQGLSMEEQFTAITEALADMDAGSERNAMGARLLGGAYTEMLPLLNAGAEGIAGLKQEADDLGIVMSESDVKAGVVLGDTIANVTAAFDGLKNQLGNAIIPIVQKFADMIIASLPKIQSIVEKVLPIVVSLLENLAPPLFDLVDALLPVIFDLVSALMPLLSDIITAILPIVVQLIETLTPLLTTIISSILPVISELLNAIMPVIQLLVDTVLPIFVTLIQELVPVVMPIVQEILPILLTLLEPILSLLNLILPPLVELIQTIIPLISKALTAICRDVLPVVKEKFSGVAEVVSGVFAEAFEVIGPIFEDIKKIISDVLKYITDVFKGDWKAVWEDIKTIFVDIWNGIKDAVKVPINFIIDGINLLIRGLNKIQIKIPDWVPGLGGETFGFNLSEVAKLRVGMEYVPYDDYPALLHRGEKVLTASEAKEERKEGKTEENGNTTSWNVPITINIDTLHVKDEQDINDLAEELMEAFQDKVDRKGAVFA